MQYWHSTSTQPARLSFSPLAMEAIRKVGGEFAQMVGWMNAEGRAEFRLGRTEALRQLDTGFRMSVERLMLDNNAEQVEATNHIILNQHELSKSEYAKAYTRFRIEGALHHGLRGEALETWIMEPAQAGPPPSEPVLLEANRTTDLEYVQAMGELLAAHQWINGNLGTGAPFRNKFEWTWRDFWESLTKDIGTKSQETAIYHPRRIANEQKVFRDLAALYALESGISMKQGMNLVASNYFTEARELYSQTTGDEQARARGWVISYRGMTNERDGLAAAYSRPENNRFNIPIPKDNVFETLAPLLCPPEAGPRKRWGKQAAEIASRHGDDHLLSPEERAKGFEPPSPKNRGRGR